MTNPVGRPLKTLDDLPKDWKEKTIEMGRNGAMDIHLRVEAMGHITHELWTRLMEDEPEFFETVQRARELAESWWKGKPAAHLENREFNTNLFGKVMSNKYGWRDVKAIDNTNKYIGADGKPVDPPNMTVNFIDGSE